nr:O-antigen ligase family protein [uncultured Sulfurimonas sp.]
MKDLATQEKLFNILSIIFIVEIVLSLFEAFTDFRLPISPFSSYITYFGRDIKFDESLDSSIVSIILQSPTGFQWNPNNLSVTMLIVLPFFLLYKKKYIKYTGVISIFLLIVMSGSRGVFIAFSFMIFLYLFFLNKKRFLLSISILPLIVILLISNLDTLKNSENNKINEIATSFDVLIIYLEGNNDGSNSIGIRQQLIKNGLDALIVSNFLGVGGGGSVAVQEKYGDIRGHATTSMHNFWIEMLVDSGVLFTIFFLLWYTYIVLKLYLIGIRTKHLKFKYYSQALFLSMSSFTLGAISASTVIYLLPMWIMFSFAIATINNYKRYKNETITTLKP